jgi:hypothetical protein
MKGTLLSILLSAVVAAAPLGARPSSVAAPLGSAVQEIAFGTVQGVVAQDGSGAPIPNARVTVTVTPQTMRSLRDAITRGAAGIPQEIVQALVAAPVGARGASGPPPLSGVTDASGHFSITVPEGSVVVRAEADGFFGPFTNGVSQPFVTTTTTVAAKQPAAVKLSMIPGGTINGRVTDPSGKPMVDVPIGVLRRSYRNGFVGLEPIDGKQSDDRGTYRLYRLPPGEYYILALVPHPPAGTQATSIVPVSTMYPSATDVSTAVPVKIKSGDDIPGIDIQVRTAATFTISGRVTSTLPAGSEVSAMNGATRPPLAILTLLPRDETVLPDVMNPNITAKPDGTFEIHNVTPGSYSVVARMPVSVGWGPQNAPDRATSPWAFGRAVVDVRDGNVESVSILVHQGIDIPGRVMVDGTAEPATLRVSLQPDDYSPTYNAFFSTINDFAPPIDQSGAFLFPLMPEAKYRFQVAFGAAPPARQAPGAPPAAPVTPVVLPPSAYVADVLMGGASVYDSGVTIGGEAVGPIEVHVKTDGGSVEGSAVGADQKAAPGATIVLVPASSRRQNPALFHTATSDMQGHFAFAGIAPGPYKVFGWDSVLAGAYQNAEFLRKYENQGEAITISASGSAKVTVHVIHDQR